VWPGYEIIGKRCVSVETLGFKTEGLAENENRAKLRKKWHFSETLFVASENFTQK
jgi:hypothetical protein